MIKTYDDAEIRQFDQHASAWWTPDGPFKPLHDINPQRLKFIKEATTIHGKKILDLGCGGGILTESLAMGGAVVVGIDASEQAISVAKAHATQSQVHIDYHHSTPEDFAVTHPQSFDAITCMEMLEHVPCPLDVLKHCAAMLKPSGDLFLSTINRTPKAYALAVIGAEYLMKILPKGTHSYQQFIKPCELARWARQANCILKNIQGIHYNPFTGYCTRKANTTVNYIMHLKRSD